MATQTLPNVLPDCRAKVARGAQRLGGVNWVSVFCANCGNPGPLVPEENTNFAFYLCNACYETHGQIAGTMAMPDEVFFAKVKEAQIEKYGRELSAYETSEALKNSDHILNKLARERPGG